MIEAILPPAVASAHVLGEPTGGELYPEEEPVVARAVESRRLQFATARTCARRALAQLGLPPGPIPRGERNSPIWPPGVVGSITHCEGYCAAAVAHADDFASLGIDAEEHAPLPPGILERVALPEERTAIAALRREDPDVCWDRLLFSAKESVYKVWFPLVRRWLGFEDAALRLDPQAQAFDARILVPAHTEGGLELTRLRGRWLVRDGLVATAIAFRNET